MKERKLLSILILLVVASGATAGGPYGNCGEWQGGGSCPVCPASYPSPDRHNVGSTITTIDYGNLAQELLNCEYEYDNSPGTFWSNSPCYRYCYAGPCAEGTSQGPDGTCLPDVSCESGEPAGYWDFDYVNGECFMPPGDYCVDGCEVRDGPLGVCFKDQQRSYGRWEQTGNSCESGGAGAPPDTPVNKPGTSDSDGDGYPFKDEVEGQPPTSPDSDDTDGDGLPDREGGEGTNPANPDSDGDGYSDGDEVGAGTDPLDAGDPGGGGLGGEGSGDENGICTAEPRICNYLKDIEEHTEETVKYIGKEDDAAKADFGKRVVELEKAVKSYEDVAEKGVNDLEGQLDDGLEDIDGEWSWTSSIFGATGGSCPAINVSSTITSDTVNILEQFCIEWESGGREVLEWLFYVITVGAVIWIWVGAGRT